MRLSLTLKSYHLRAAEVKNDMGKGNGLEAWQKVEKEYFAISGKRRYNSYDCFRKEHCLFNQRLSIITAKKT